MSCKTTKPNNVIDIENLKNKVNFNNRKTRFKNIHDDVLNPKNIEKYISIVKILINFYNDNNKKYENKKSKNRYESILDTKSRNVELVLGITLILFNPILYNKGLFLGLILVSIHFIKFSSKSNNSASFETNIKTINKDKDKNKNKKSNYDYNTFKKLFNKQLDKSTKRSDIKVSKLHLVCCYNYMVEKRYVKLDLNFKQLISKAPTRNASGVNSFAVLLGPYPNGQEHTCEYDCYYCPDQKGVSRSYLLEEPAVQRGFQNGWNVFLQILDRFLSLIDEGHIVDKIEIIVEGGTFTNYPKDYLNTYFRDIYYACNVFYDIQTNPNYKLRPRLTLNEEMYISVHQSKIKLIGICIETRPDTITDEWIKYFRYLGITRIQIGVQHTDNKLLKRINRGHTFEQSCHAMKLLKDNCFKVDIHLMPDLPYSNPQKDKEMLNKVFNTDIICPDGVKIYPCQITIFTVIKKWYDSGKYIPYSEKDFDQFMDVIKYGMEIVPKYVRVARIIRDFDFNKHVQGGNPYSNLKQMATDQMRKEGKICQDIRSREISRHPRYNYDETCKINILEYDNGQEYFISMVSHDEVALFGFIRLRIPKNDKNNPYKPVFNILKNKGLIRELHVYNTLVSVGNKSESNSSQHKGIGKLLVKMAEKIAISNGCNGTCIISGEGVRKYYQKHLGYQTIESFEVKTFGLLDYLNLIF